MQRPSRTRNHRFFYWLSLCFVSLPELSLSTPLEIQDCIHQAINYAPSLKSADAAIEQYQFLSKQSTRLPNPAMTFESENFGGSDAYSGTDSAEYTLSLEQKVELGGKRSLRKDQAQLDLSEVQLKQSLIKGSVEAETRRRFLRLAIAQQHAELAASRLESAKTSEATVQKRQGLGVANALDIQRVEIAVSLADIQYAEAQEKREIAKLTLASMWGEDHPDFEAVKADLKLPETLPSFETIERLLQSTLLWKINDINLKRGEMLVSQEKSIRYPDLTLSAGRRWFNADNAQTWNIGVSMDIPLFDRNQNAVKAASAYSRKTNYETANARQQMREQLVQAYSSIRSAWLTAQNLGETTLVKARKSYDLATEGYQLGRYELLYLLEVQQTMFEIETMMLDARASFYEAAIDLFELTADQTPESLMF